MKGCGSCTDGFVISRDQRGLTWARPCTCPEGDARQRGLTSSPKDRDKKPTTTKLHLVKLAEPTDKEWLFPDGE